MDDDVPLTQDPHLMRLEADLEDIGRDAEHAALAVARRVAPIVAVGMALVVVAWLLGRSRRRRAHDRV